MGLFGDDRAEEIEALNQQIEEGVKRRKALAEKLVAERKVAEALRIELGKIQAELAAAKRAVAKARYRQKASVARANRFKAKLGSNSSAAIGS